MADEPVDTPELRIERDALENRLQQLGVDVVNYLDKRFPKDSDEQFPAVPTDMILVVGVREFHPDDTVHGKPYTFPLQRSMPGYVSRGLLNDCIDAISYYGDEDD